MQILGEIKNPYSEWTKSTAICILLSDGKEEGKELRMGENGSRIIVIRKETFQRVQRGSTGGKLFWRHMEKEVILRVQ